MNRRQRRAAAKARRGDISQAGGSASVDRMLGAAVSQHQAGRLAEAKRLYAEVLSQEPQNVLALHLLGVIEYQEGDARRASELIGQAVALRPDYAEAHSNLGNALRDQGKFEEAVAACRRALALKPDFAEAHNNLGNALGDQGKFEDAVAAYRRALALKPDYAEAHNNLGSALRNQDQLEDAVAAYRRALALKPDNAEAHSNLGNALRDQGQLEAAVVACRRALELRPDYAEALNNLGAALNDQGQLEDAVAAYRRALALKPDYAEAHHNLSQTLLLAGRLEEGWPEYEYRWQAKWFRPGVQDLDAPLWDGAPLDGKTVLVHAEQGLGDTIQFARYLPRIAERGGRVLFEVPKRLKWLMTGAKGVAALVENGGPPPAFDCHVPLLSLPRIFGTDLDSIPATVPYLDPPKRSADSWSSRVGQLPGLKVGICWQGNPENLADRKRSCRLAAFAPLAGLDGVTLISLQKGAGEEQLDRLPADVHIERLGDTFDAGADAFRDTVTVLRRLDLVITIDTATAHLAGALARPTWVLLPFIPDWRWQLGREDSPWYPSFRLFRQPKLGDWDAVFGDVARALTTERDARREAITAEAAAAPVLR